MSSLRAARRSPEPVRAAPPELVSPTRPLVRRLGKVRIPLSLTHQPWATAYRLPSGQTIWCVRRPRDGQVVRSVVSTRLLRRYARSSGLRPLEVAIDEIAGTDGV